MKLIIPEDVERQIGEVVYATSRETGVSLFGEKDGQDFRVLGMAGPGPDATHQDLHYSGNNDYATMVFEDLRKANLNLQHIGELHVHPFRMKCLSIGDIETVKELLKEYEEFIAGVMLRGWRISFYPVYFSRSQPEGTKMEVSREGQTYRANRFGLRRRRDR